MKKNNFVVWVMLFGMLVPLDVFAYIDPGAGSALLQGIIGGLAAVVVVLKLYWYRVMRFLGIRKDSSKKVDREISEKIVSKSEEK